MVLYNDISSQSKDIRRNNQIEFHMPSLSTLCKHLTASCETWSGINLTNIVKEGKMPLKNDKLIKSWELLSVNLYGPWTLKCEFKEPEEKSSE